MQDIVGWNPIVKSKITNHWDILQHTPSLPQDCFQRHPNKWYILLLANPEPLSISNIHFHLKGAEGDTLEACIPGLVCFSHYFAVSTNELKM